MADPYLDAYSDSYEGSAGDAPGAGTYALITGHAAIIERLVLRGNIPAFRAMGERAALAAFLGDTKGTDIRGLLTEACGYNLDEVEAIKVMLDYDVTTENEAYRKLAELYNPA